jgi:cob(I)alamin adenosyltransferase
MHISTKKGDSGYTGLLTGGRVPKHHLIIEAVGTLDEANSQLAVARASSQQKRTKRIILQVQKQLFIIGAELSVPKGKGKRCPPDSWLSGKMKAHLTWMSPEPVFEKWKGWL